MILIRRLAKLCSLRPTSIPSIKSTSLPSKSSSIRARARTQIFLTKDNSIGFFSSTSRSTIKLNPTLKLVNQRLQSLEVVGGRTLLGAERSVNSSWKPVVKVAGITLVTALYHLNTSSGGTSAAQVVGGVGSAQETIVIGGNSSSTSNSDLRSYRSLLPTNSPFRFRSDPILSTRTSINQFQPQFGLQFRTYSTTREKQVENITSQIKPDKLVDLNQIMNDLRDLELLDVLRGQPQKSELFFSSEIQFKYSSTLFTFFLGGNSWKDAARKI